MEKKLPWLKYDMKQSEYIEIKEKEKEAKQKVEETARRLRDLNKPIE